MVFLVSQAQGAEWVPIYTDKDGSRVFYNRESVAELPTGIIKVWMKEEFSDKSKEEFMSDEDAGDAACYSSGMLSYILFLFEFNCSEKKRRFVAFSCHSADGQVLASYSFEEGSFFSSWDPIDSALPEVEKLYQAVCPPQEKK